MHGFSTLLPTIYTQDSSYIPQRGKNPFCSSLYRTSELPEKTCADKERTARNLCLEGKKESLYIKMIFPANYQQKYLLRAFVFQENYKLFWIFLDFLVKRISP